jgi:carboxymethylenebutenolidase
VIEFEGVANPDRDDAPPPRTESGYLARPAGGGGRGVLVLHPWWGLNDTVKEMCDGLAQAGFVVLAPDMFDGEVATTIGEAEELAGRKEEQDLPRLEQILLGALDRLAAETDGPLGMIGFSFGAGYGLWVARKRPEQVVALVLFYGTGGAVGEGLAQVMGHFAQDDPYEPAENVDELEADLRASGRLEACHRYPGTSHWFAEPDRPEFEPQAAGLAWERTLAFLRQRLGP